MDFEKRISDYGMTPEQYEASFAEITAKVQGNSDKDWTEIIDQYSIPLSRNTLRNACSNVYGCDDGVRSSGSGVCGKYVGYGV